MEIKFGEKYELKQDREYFCIPIQRSVKFTTPVYVEAVCKSTIHFMDSVNGSDSVYFEKLIGTGCWGAPDYVTENEIVFHEEDVIGLYTMKNGLFLYMDFAGILEKECKNEEV